MGFFSNIVNAVSSVSGVGSLISGGASLIGGMISGNQQAKAQREANQTNLQINRETNEANAKLASQQNEWNIAQWQRENEYNSPAAQMQRYREAGINPAFALGQGNITSGLASSVQSADLANQQSTSVMPEDMSSGLSQGFQGLANAISQYAPNSIAKQNADANTKNASTQASLAEAEIGKKGAEKANIEADTQRVQKQIELYDAQIKQMSAATNQILSQTKLSDWQNFINQHYGVKQIEATINQMNASSLASIGQYKLASINADLAPLYAKVAQSQAKAMWYNAQTSRMHLAIDQQNADANTQNAQTNWFNALTNRNTSDSNIHRNAVQNETEEQFARKEITQRINNMVKQGRLTDEQADLLHKQNEVFYLKFSMDCMEQYSRIMVNGTQSLNNMTSSIGNVVGLGGKGAAATPNMSSGPAFPSSVWQSGL